MEKNREGENLTAKMNKERREIGHRSAGADQPSYRHLPLLIAYYTLFLPLALFFALR
jgi:hypothetical protein